MAERDPYYTYPETTRTVTIVRYTSRASTGCSIGCGLLLLGGVLLGALGAAVGVGFSARPPESQIGFSGGAAIGNRNLTEETLPSYTRYGFDNESDLFTQSSKFTFWFFDGRENLNLGRQPDVPNIDFQVKLLSGERPLR